MRIVRTVSNSDHLLTTNDKVMKKAMLEIINCVLTLTNAPKKFMTVTAMPFATTQLGRMLALVI